MPRKRQTKAAKAAAATARAAVAVIEDSTDEPPFRLPANPSPIFKQGEEEEAIEGLCFERGDSPEITLTPCLATDTNSCTGSDSMEESVSLTGSGFDDEPGSPQEAPTLERSASRVESSTSTGSTSGSGSGSNSTTGSDSFADIPTPTPISTRSSRNSVGAGSSAMIKKVSSPNPGNVLIPSDIDADPTKSLIRSNMQTIVKIVDETIPHFPVEFKMDKAGIVAATKENILLNMVDAEMTYTAATKIVNELADEIIKKSDVLDEPEFLDAVDSIKVVALNRLATYQASLTTDMMKEHPTYIKCTAELDNILARCEVGISDISFGLNDDLCKYTEYLSHQNRNCTIGDINLDAIDDLDDDSNANNNGDSNMNDATGLPASKSESDLRNISIPTDIKRKLHSNRTNMDDDDGDYVIGLSTLLADTPVDSAASIAGLEPPDPGVAEIPKKKAKRSGPRRGRGRRRR